MKKIMKKICENQRNLRETKIKHKRNRKKSAKSAGEKKK